MSIQTKESIRAALEDISKALAKNEAEVVAPLIKKRAQLQRDLGPFVAGYNINDDVVDKTGRKGKCTGLSATSYHGNSSLYGTIRLYKKDGTLGERHVTIYNYDQWKKAGD